MRLLAFQVPNELHVDLDAGNDVLEAGRDRLPMPNRLYGDAGNDTVGLADVTAKNLNASLGAGNDWFGAQRVRVREELTLLASRGNDHAELSECTADVADLNGGVGSDGLRLGGNRFGRLYLHGWEYVEYVVPALSPSEPSA